MADCNPKEVQAVPEFKTPPKASLFWGAMSQWFSIGISVILGFLVNRIFVHALGNEAYGLWGLAASFVGFYGLFDFGLGNAVGRFLGNAIGSKDLKQFNRVISTGNCLYFIIAFLIIVAALAIMVPAQSILRIPEQYTTQFRILVILSAGGMAFTTITSVYSSAVMASEGFFFLSLTQIVTVIVRSIGGLMAVLSGFGVVGLAATQVFITALQRPVIYAGCKKRLPQMKVSISAFDKATAKSMFGFGAVTFIAMVSEVVRSRLDVMLVTRFGGLSDAGLYAMASLAYGYVCRAISAVIGVTTPRLNKLYGAGNMDDLRGFFLRASHITAAATVLVFGTIVGLAPVLIRLWLGPGYEKCAIVLRILTAGYFLDFATNPGIGSMYATAKLRYFAGQTIVEAVTSFSLAVILGAKYGMVGVALGIVTPLTLIKMTAQPWYVTRNLGIRWVSYWFRVIAMPILAIITLVAGLSTIEYYNNLWGWWVTPLVLIFVEAASCAILWKFVLDKSDREHILSRIRVRMSGFSAITVKMGAFSKSQSRAGQ